MITVKIKVTTMGADTGPNFNLYSDLNFATPFETNVQKTALMSADGYVSHLVPDATSIIRVQSIGTCTSYIDIVVPPPTSTTSTTTSSTSSTTTTTSTSSSTTTSTSTTSSTSTTTTTSTTTGLYTVWYTRLYSITGAICTDGQSTDVLYTSSSYIPSPLTIPNFYIDSGLSILYNPGADVIGYSDVINTGKYFADIDGSGNLSNWGSCVTPSTSTSTTTSTTTSGIFYKYLTDIYQCGSCVLLYENKTIHFGTPLTVGKYYLETFSGNVYHIKSTSLTSVSLLYDAMGPYDTCQESPC